MKNALEYIRQRGSIVADERQGEEWGTEADWSCLLDDIAAGAERLEQIGTGGVSEAEFALALEASHA